MARVGSAAPEEDGSVPLPLTRALRGMLDHGLALLQVRLELLGVETQEALQRMVALLAWLFVAAVALALGLVFLAIWLTVLLWDSHRLLALTAFAVMFLSLGGWGAWQVRRLLSDPVLPFAGTVAELKADRESLSATSEPGV